MDAGTPSTNATLAPPSLAPPSAPTPRQTIGLLLRAQVHLLVIALLVASLGTLMPNRLVAHTLGAAAVSLAAARLGMEGDDFGARARQRLLRGVAIAFAVAAFALLVVLLTGARPSAHSPNAGLLLGLVDAGAIAYRDEIWLIGMPLWFAHRAGIPKRAALAFVVLASGAAVALNPDSTAVGLVLVCSSATCFAMLWWRGGDVWAAIPAHAAWIWLSEAVLAGEVIDLSGVGSTVGHGARSGGTWGLCASAGFLLAAGLLWQGKLRLPRYQLAAEEPAAAASKATTKSHRDEN